MLRIVPPTRNRQAECRSLASQDRTELLVLGYALRTRRHVIYSRRGLVIHLEQSDRDTSEQALPDSAFCSEAMGRFSAAPFPAMHPASRCADHGIIAAWLPRTSRVRATLPRYMRGSKDGLQGVWRVARVLHNVRFRLGNFGTDSGMACPANLSRPIERLSPHSTRMS